ncbi:Y-family DNA polymerase [Puniceibacterium confluentis]|uniref:Y-family DNA polymerase n=1 Tax=Puniceibacterium confluentis TaxID=1958944 RepID=UPI0035630F85
MPPRRILSLWFPRLGAERQMRQTPHLGDSPFAVVRDTGQTQLLCSLSPLASQAGLRIGQPLRDAHAICPTLLTRLENPHVESAFLDVLHRWAGKYSPWVARQDPDALVLDITGCAHLFGGEKALAEGLQRDCADLGLSVHLGIADTLGAAWALARYSARDDSPRRTGDAIDQEARATRARAGKRRHWERGGSAPVTAPPAAGPGRIAPPGKPHSVLSSLPIAALRLEPLTVEHLTRLGLRRIGDLLGQPRAALARRFGRELVLRLDQAMGSAPEPLTPAAPAEHFSTRLSLPDPIGLESDLLAALDRMLPTLCRRLERKGTGARTLRFEVYRTDQTMQWVTVSLARPAHDPDRLRPLLAMKLPEIEAGFGIDMIRLDAIRTEPLHGRTRTGHLAAGAAVATRLQANTALDDLMGRIGARIGLEQITRRHPAASHLPEKSALTLAAAWSPPAAHWPEPSAPRPLLIWRPEPVQAADTVAPPVTFRWRGRDFVTSAASGPERIAPEWWFDDPDWRSGLRDYWRIDTDRGDQLWLYFAHGAGLSPGWFCHGSFA